MADHTFEELKKKNAAELKEIAKGIEHEAVHLRLSGFASD